MDLHFCYHGRPLTPTCTRPFPRPAITLALTLTALLAGCDVGWAPAEHGGDEEGVERGSERQLDLQTGALVGAWSSQDIGAVGTAGSWTESGGSHTVKASGADFYGTADAFRFVYQDFTGDVTVTARVSSLENKNSWTKAAVMIRQDLTAGSKNVATVVSPTSTNKYRQQVRNAAGGSSTTTSSAASSAIPSWLRLERVGSTFRSYHSSNGTSWTLMATSTVSMTGTVRAGLALTSHVVATLATGVFTNVTLVTPAPPAPPLAPAGLTATGGDNRVTLAWPAASGATSYTVKRAGVAGGPHAPLQAGISATSFIDTTAVNGTTYYYVVSASNAAGEGPASVEALATPAPPPPPPAPTGLTATPGNDQVGLSWAATSGAASYTVKGGTSAGGPYDVLQGGITATSFTAGGLTNGVTYHFVVSASNVSGESPDSAPVAATPVASVTAVSAECQRWQGLALTRVSPADSAALDADLASAVPGTMIELRANTTYTASGTPQRFRIVGRNGTATSKIYLCGPRSAVLRSTITLVDADDGGMSTNYGLWLSNSSHWVIDGFTVRTVNKGVMLDGSSNNTVRYLHVHELGEEAIHLRRSSSDNIVEYNLIENTGNRVPGFGEAIYVGTAAGNWVKVMGTLTADKSDNNTIRFNTTRSRSEGVDVKEGTRNGRIEGNTIHGTFLAGSAQTSADSCMELKGTAYLVKSNHCETTLADGLQVKNQHSSACTSAGTSCPDSGKNNIFELNSTNMRTPGGGTATGYSIQLGSSATGNTVRCNNTHTNKAASYKTNVTCTP
jgi:regulation of enolase protein 1 (concanavalin A-like superfamily)